MFKYSYISSSFKPTAISEAITANFLNSNTPNLIVCKAEWLEIYSIYPTSLELSLEIPLNSQVVSIAKLSLSGEKDNILLLTESKNLLTIDYSTFPMVTSETLIPTQKGKPEPQMKLILSDCQNVSLISTEKEKFSLIFLKDCKIVESNIVASRGDSLIDMAFLKNSLSIAVLYEVKKNDFKLKIYEVISNEKSLFERRLLTLEHKPHKIISGLNNACYIFCYNEILKYSASYNTLSRFSCHIQETSAVCEANNDQYILSDNTLLYIFSSSPEFSIEVLGKSCCVSNICKISPDCFFLSSKVNDSKFFRVLPELIEDSYIQNIQTIHNIAPLIDFKINEESNLRVIDIIACSGCEETGGFRLISKGVTANIEMEQEIQNIQGIWTASFSPPYDSFMFLSFESMTKVFKIVDFNIEFLSGLEKNQFCQASLLVFAKDSFLVQVTALGVYVYSSGLELLKEFDSSILGSSINYTSNHNQYLSLSLTDQTILILKLQLPELSEHSRITIKQDISSLYIFEDYLILGFWETNNLSIYNFQTNTELYKESQSFTAAIRSTKIIKLKTKTKLIVGLRDGNLIFYQIKDNLKFFKESSLKIGYQGVLIDTLQTFNSFYVFAACDRPVILYFDNDQFHLTNISLKEVAFFSSFHTATFQHCLALCIKNRFLIVSLPQLQEFSFENYIKKYTIRRLALYEDKIVALVIGNKTQASVRLYDGEKNEIDLFMLGNNETPNCIIVLKDKVFVGVSIYVPSENELGYVQVGKVLGFSIVNDKLVMDFVNEFNTSVVSFAVIEQYLFVGIEREIVAFKIFDNVWQNLECSQKLSYPLALEVINNKIAAADLLKSISLYSFSNEKLTLTHRNYQIVCPTSIKLISPETIIASDASGYIFILQTNSNNLLEITSLYHIGSEIINTINLNTYSSRQSRETSIIFATTKGRIGVIFNLNEDKYKILKALEDLIVNDSGRSCFFDKRIIKDDKRLANIPVFVQGDIVELFMEYSPEKKICFALNVSETVRKTVGVNEILEILMEMIKIP